jgi:hypothetical protein
MEPSLSFAEWTLVVTTSLITIVGAIWTLMSYCRRPRFVVGVPPSDAEQKSKGIPLARIGRRSIVNQFRHRSDCLARMVRDKQGISQQDFRQLFSDPLRTRLLNLTSGNKATLPVVVENSGSRAARDYKLGIQILNPYVHIADITTESLDVGTFYANRVDLIENDSLRSVDRRIIKAYDNYMDIGEQYGDMIFLEGDLEGGMYELTILTLTVEPFIERFIIVYSIDCSDFWLSRRAFFQGFIITK